MKSVLYNLCCGMYQKCTAIVVCKLSNMWCDLRYGKYPNSRVAFAWKCLKCVMTVCLKMWNVFCDCCLKMWNVCCDHHVKMWKVCWNLCCGEYRMCAVLVVYKISKVCYNLHCGACQKCAVAVVCLTAKVCCNRIVM